VIILAIPNCTANTTVITTIGTTPQERGLTTDEFKAKFDEAATNIKEDLNANIIPAVNAHLADLVTDTDGVHGLKIETGTFTPTVAGVTVAGNNSYTEQTGRYMRIGKRVFFDARIKLSSKDPAMSGQACIKGLPFSANSAVRYNVYFGTTDYVTFTGQLTARINNNIVEVWTIFNTDIASGSPTAGTFFSNTSLIQISGNYEIE